MRTDPKQRTKELLRVALRLAAAKGMDCLTHDAVAQAAGVSRPLVIARLGTMTELRRSVMRAAVEERCVPVVAEGLARKDKHAQKADGALRDLAAAWVKAA